MVKKLRFDKIMEYVLLALLVGVCGEIIYFNFSDIRCSMDADFACTIYHYMEVIKQGTLQLPDWFHTTSLELDGTMLFAVPLYFVTKNMFTAVGISNILFMLMYIVVIGRLLHLYKVDKKYIYLTLILVLTPYGYGMLDYFNMLFFGGACYAVKTLVPILLLLLFLLLENKVYKTKQGKIEIAAFGAMYLYLLFATAFSTGIFVVLCGLLPILVWMVLEIFLKGNPEYLKNKMVWAAWGTTIFTFVVGYILHNKAYTAVSRTNMNITNMGDFADNFKACIRGIYELLGAITLEDVPVLSVDGIILCVKMVFGTAFLAALFWNYIKFSNEGREQKESGFNLKNYLAFMFVWTFFVMFIADMRFTGNDYTEYRYFIIGMVPLIMLFGLQLNSLDKVFNDFQKKMAYVVLLAACVVLVYGNHRNVVEKWDRSTYAMEFTEYVDALDVESVIFLDDRDTSTLCKGIDNTHKYGAYMSDTQSFYLWICSYYESAYGSFYGNRHVLAAIRGTDIYQCMPVEIAQNYVKIDEFKWFDIYISDVMLLP